MNRPRLQFLANLLDPETARAYLAQCQANGPQDVRKGEQDVAEAVWLKGLIDRNRHE